MIAEQQAIFGTKSLTKSLSTKKTPKALTISPSQKTLGAATKTDSLSPKSTHTAKKVYEYELNTDRMPSFADFWFNVKLKLYVYLGARGVNKADPLENNEHPLPQKQNLSSPDKWEMTFYQHL